MNRKEFIAKSLCCLFGVASINILFPKKGHGQTLKECKECTPSEERISFTKTWVQRFMAILDRHMDKEARTAMMHECGRRCFIESNLPAKEDKKMNIDVFISKLQEYAGTENCYRDGNVVRFNYVSNPRGLKTSEGYCLCPLLEDGPKEISPTYCQCSVGYIGEMFNRAIGYTPKVELLESVRTGGKGCKFIIHLV